MTDVGSAMFENAGDGFCRHCGKTRYVHTHREGVGFLCDTGPKPFVRGQKINIQNAPSSLGQSVAEWNRAKWSGGR